MGGHIIRCYTIANNTGQPFFVLDGEDPAQTLTIDANKADSFRGTALPWCADVSDVVGKAFRFFEAVVPKFFLFQTFIPGNLVSINQVAMGVAPTFPGTFLRFTVLGKMEVIIASNGT